MFAKFRIISIIGDRVKFTMEYQNKMLREYDWQDFDVLAWLKGWIGFDSFLAHEKLIAVPLSFISLTPPFERR